MTKVFWKSVGVRGVLLVLLTLMAYFPAMRGGFIWDDYDLVANNPMIKAKDGLYRFWFTTESPDYYPLTWSLWWLEWRLWGPTAGGYHVVNVLLHAGNAVLVWMVLRRLKIPGAWMAGLVFAVHPVNVATVGWISEQKNTLSMLFFLVAILQYLKFDEEGRWRRYGFSLAAFLLALLSKTAVVMLPVVLLGCIGWKRGRMKWRDFLYCAPFFALSLGFGLVTIWFQHYRALGGLTYRTVGFASRLAAAGWVPWFYLSKTLLPVGLTVIYPKWEADASYWVSYLPGLILIGSFSLFWWKRRTWGGPLFFGLGYFVVMLFPVMGFFDQGFYRFSLVADHWQYYSMAGVVALVVAAGQRICRRMGEYGGYLATAASVTVLMVLGAATWERGRLYAGDEALWRDNVIKNPNAWIAHNNLGLGLASQGKLAEATAEYQAALRIDPNLPDGYNNQGNILARQGRIAEAIAEYVAALRIRPDYAEAHNNLGLALASQGKLAEATAEYQAALRIDSDLAAPHNNLGNILASEGKVAEAVAEYDEALRIKPDYAESHCNLGIILAGQGKVSEAIAQYREAVRLKPDWPAALSKLAWLLATDGNQNVRNAAEAVPLAERLCEITGYQQPEALDVLAAAYAGVGRFGDAIRVARKAIDLAGKAGQSGLARQVQERLTLYQAGRAFHQ